MYLGLRYNGDASTASSPWTAGLDITVTKGTHPAPADDSSYYGIGVQVDKGGELELVAPPEGFGAATYSVTDTSICSVDASSGTVTGIESGDCTVQVAFAGDNQYGPWRLRTCRLLRWGEEHYPLRGTPTKMEWSTVPEVRA